MKRDYEEGKWLGDSDEDTEELAEFLDKLTTATKKRKDKYHKEITIAEEEATMGGHFDEDI